MNKIITVKPLGGLANRMRVLESAFYYARKYQYPVRIIWERSFALNCSFIRLFRLPENTCLTEFSKSPLKVRTTAYMQRLKRKIGMQVPSGHAYYLVDDDALNPDKVSKLSSYHDIYIETVHKFVDLDEGTAVLTPVHDIQAAIDNVKANFKGYTLGVHIRRTDNINSIRFSPLEEFINVIDSEKLKNSGLSIFLATDSRSEENAIKTRYPGRVISLQKSLNRDHEQGIRDALIDLYCLSVSDKIIGSYYSSFSEVAAHIGKKPFIQIYKDPGI